MEAAAGNPELFSEIFCYNPVKLNDNWFESMFIIQYSEGGSNKRMVENSMISFRNVYIQDGRTKNSGKHFLQWNIIFCMWL